MEHDCYHCDKAAEWIWTSENGHEIRNICTRCSETLEPYMASSGRQFSVIRDIKEWEIPHDLLKEIQRKVARECAVIAADADTNYDAEQEILTRFDCF